MPRNRFADIEVGSVSNWRRVGHSTTNYFSSIDRASFRMNNVGTQVVNATANFASVTGGVGGSIAIGMSAAAAGGLAGAGFLAAIAGPQVAVTAAVVGVALLVKGSYSNREAAHKEISKYVWSLVHDEPPQFLTLQDYEKVADAATTLMDDGKNQIKLLGSKMKSAHDKFTIVNQKMTALHDELIALRAEKQRMRAVVGGAAQIALVTRQIGVVKEKAKALWEKESKTGGGIFEYVRRCSHTANYLQAPHIMAMTMRFKLENALTAQSQNDYFFGSAHVAALRKSFTDLDALYSQLANDEPAGP